MPAWFGASVLQDMTSPDCAMYLSALHAHVLDGNTPSSAVSPAGAGAGAARHEIRADSSRSSVGDDTDCSGSEERDSDSSGTEDSSSREDTNRNEEVKRSKQPQDQGAVCTETAVALLVALMKCASAKETAAAQRHLPAVLSRLLNLPGVSKTDCSPYEQNQSQRHLQEVATVWKSAEDALQHLPVSDADVEHLADLAGAFGWDQCISPLMYSQICHALVMPANTKQTSRSGCWWRCTGPIPVATMAVDGWRGLSSGGTDDSVDAAAAQGHPIRYSVVACGWLKKLVTSEDETITESFGEDNYRL